ncbi:TPA: hypothetical protein ACH3X3_000958 [Trebouxia sp. C0006]
MPSVLADCIAEASDKRCTETTAAYVPRFRYSAQKCKTPMQAQVSMLIKNHQLMVKYDVYHISPTTASSDSTHKPCDQCGLKIPAHQALLHLTRHTSLVTDVDWNKVQRSLVQNSNASTTG